MRRIILSFMFALGAMTIAQADTTLPKTCSVSQPECLAKRLIKESDIAKVNSANNWGQPSRTNKAWIVYSDRDDNIAYNEPNKASGQKTMLKLNQKLRIAEIRNDFALVYTELDTRIQFPNISAASQKKGAEGWVPMKNLLLWESCPANEKGIYQKALIVMNLNEWENHVNDDDVSKLFSNPETKSFMEEIRSSMNFYYVMKQGDNGLVLLSKSPKLTDGYSDNVLKGWVNKNTFIPWNQRTCLESNWDTRVAEQLIGQTVTVFRDTMLTQPQCYFPLARENRMKDVSASSKYRMRPNEMRYPLLDFNPTSPLYMVTAFSRPNGEAHVEDVPDENGSDGLSVKEWMLEQRSIINVIVAIDGTTSMEKYYPPTQKIINEVNSYFAENNNKVRVGVVIYRDYSDGKYVTEYVPMSRPNDPKIVQMLTNGGEYGIKSSANDRTYTEALYKGLELALDTIKMGYSKNNSNLLFVVGDCGNDENDTECLSAEELIDKCVANNVQLTAFQVRNKNEQSFLSFRSQMQYMVRENLKRQYSKLGAGVKVKLSEVSDGYELQTKLDKELQFFIGSIRNAELDMDMDVNKLQFLMKNGYQQFSDAVKNTKDLVNNADEKINFVRDENSNSISVNARMEASYLQSLFTPEQVKALMKRNTLMAYATYTRKKQPETDYNYWKPVVYISADELAALLESLKPVHEVFKQQGTNRKPYVEAMKALVRTMLPEIKEKDMNDMGDREIMAMIAGLNEASGALKGRKLSEIQDETKVNKVEFSTLMARFVDKYNKLNEIITQKEYKFSVKINNNVWYWLPVEDLP